MEPSEIMKKLFFIRRKRLNANHFVHRSEDSVLIGSDGKMNSNVVAPAARQRVWAKMSLERD
jgi:hypothetical protein